MLQAQPRRSEMGRFDSAAERHTVPNNAGALELARALDGGSADLSARLASADGSLRMPEIMEEESTGAANEMVRIPSAVTVLGIFWSSWCHRNLAQ